MSKINIEQCGNYVKVYTSGVAQGVYFQFKGAAKDVKAAKHALSGTVREKALAIKAQFAGEC